MMMATEYFRTANMLAVYYADPGSGALLWQLIGSFFIGLMFYFRRIASWISPHNPDKQSQDAVRNKE